MRSPDYQSWLRWRIASEGFLRADADRVVAEIIGAKTAE
jgi:hypothetical protein